MTPQVRVGVGCFVRNALVNRNEVLVGIRKGSHGAGKLSLPGGHLEMGESWENCAAREVLEETNLTIGNIRHLRATNDVFIDGNLNKHYITLFMEADVMEDTAPLTNMEPQKCESWRWINVDELARMCVDSPDIMFDPLVHFFEQGGSKYLASSIS